MKWRYGWPVLGDFVNKRICFSKYRTGHYIDRIDDNDMCHLREWSSGHSCGWRHRAQLCPTTDFYHKSKFNEGDKVRDMLEFGTVQEVRANVNVGNIDYVYKVTWANDFLKEDRIWADV